MRQPRERKEEYQTYAEAITWAAKHTGMTETRVRLVLSHFLEAAANRMAQGKLFHMRGLGLFGPSYKRTKGDTFARLMFIPSLALAKKYAAPGTLKVDHLQQNRDTMQGRRKSRRGRNWNRRCVDGVPKEAIPRLTRMRLFARQGDQAVNIPEAFKRLRMEIAKEQRATGRA